MSVHLASLGQSVRMAVSHWDGFEILCSQVFVLVLHWQNWHLHSRGLDLRISMSLARLNRLRRRKKPSPRYVMPSSWRLSKCSSKLLQIETSRDVSVPERPHSRSLMLTYFDIRPDPRLARAVLFQEVEAFPNEVFTKFPHLFRRTVGLYVQVMLQNLAVLKEGAR